MWQLLKIGALSFFSSNISGISNFDRAVDNDADTSIVRAVLDAATDGSAEVS